MLFFNYVGFELPNAAGDEMEDPQRDVPFTVIRAALGTFVLYGAPILAILLVLPTSQITSLGGFLDAIKTVFTVYGGHVTTAADGTVTATLTGAGKVLGDLAALGVHLGAALQRDDVDHGRRPRAGRGRLRRRRAALVRHVLRALGHADRRQPAVAASFSTVVMVLAFQLTGGNAGKYFTAVLRLAISTTTISYLLVFPALVKLRYSHPHVPRPYRVPAAREPGAWICSLLCTGWAALATVALLYPGFGTAHPDDALPEGFENARGAFERSQFVPLALLVCLGLVFYASGARTRAQRVDLPLVDETRMAPVAVLVSSARAGAPSARRGTSSRAARASSRACWPSRAACRRPATARRRPCR